MPTDPAFWIFIAALIGGIIGIVGTALFFRSRNHRVSQDAWNQAELFYTRRSDPSARRL